MSATAHTPILWLKSGRRTKWLVTEPNRLYLCRKCICTCEPKVLARYALPPGSYWDLSPYQVRGFAGDAPYKRKWQIRECTGGLRYGDGDITTSGTLVGLPDRFNARYGYTGYMTLQMCCVDDHGNLIEPPCERW